MIPTGVTELGCFGYDILPPAIYADNTLAIAGYYGTGFCRIGLDGQQVWTTEFAEADLLPTINSHSVAAVGSLNDETSAFFSSEGKFLGTYARASIFAEYSPEAWIARSHQYVAQLTVEGQECWGVPLHDDANWGHCQPIVDGQGRIYVLDDANLLCLTGEGNVVFTTKLQENSQGGLSCISPGKLAYVGGGMLKIIG
jgi:outer membrane protein assembly factor BamB